MKICVSCGAEATDRLGRPVAELYDATLFAKSQILRLRECRACGQTVDPYLEREGTLVLLDMALQSQAVLRHVLVNSGDYTLLILKMVLLTIIVDGYCRWAGEQEGEQQFFEREFEFYIKCVEAVSSLLVYLTVTLLPTLARGATHRFGTRRLVIGLLLAYCTRFLQLLALLWSTSPDTAFLWWFVDMLYYLTSLNILQVLTRFDSLRANAVLLVAHGALHLIEQQPLLP